MRDEEKKHFSQKSKIQQFFRKRWVFPAMYLVSAAVILTAVLWYQSVGNNLQDDLAQNNDNKDTAYTNEPAVEVNKPTENVVSPALDPDAVKIVKEFYDESASVEEQEAALVFYNNTYRPNKGIDLAREDQKEFDVVAVLSGTVKKSAKDPILGHVIEIEHEDKVVTVYQSLASAKVQAGDKVKQNDVIGKAGKNLLNEKDGIHVHFEIRKDGKAVNPSAYMNKPATSITAETEKENAAEGETPAADSEASEGAEEEAPKQDESDEAKEEENKETEEQDPAENKEQSDKPEASKSSLNS
ncbi:peptidoglycan DD-metalloendopeptidase family protein [Metabacillus fastidiosus]|uniref:peptidoglycan DD-metalloendopeptidase family protein n=1 Tax=Metabacillus fastidiosus TaxID=1458 RepID=UPI003D2D8472